MLCTRTAELAREQGLVVGGVLTHPCFASDRKVGLEVEDLRTGRRCPLAEPNGGNGQGPATGAWHFRAAGLAFGAQALAQATPCHLLIVDELGPLELERGEGWPVALEVLAGGDYRLALAVVRPELVDEFRRQLGGEPPEVAAGAADCDALAERILGELGDLG